MRCAPPRRSSTVTACDSSQAHKTRIQSTSPVGLKIATQSVTVGAM